MKITFDVTEREARLIHTFIRRSCFEQYYQNMSEAGDDLEKANNRAYDTINAFCAIRDAIEEAL